MASWQRKVNSKTVTLYPRKLVTDARGNNQYVTDTDPANAIKVPYSESWLRSSKAEVPGQQTIDVRKLIIPHTVPYDYVTVWARARFPGETENDVWDVIAPPEYHHGTRHVRHWTIVVRWRPDLNG
jgi:hypothetical protein